MHLFRHVICHRCSVFGPCLSINLLLYLLLEVTCNIFRVKHKLIIIIAFSVPGRVRSSLISAPRCPWLLTFGDSHGFLMFSEWFRASTASFADVAVNRLLGGLTFGWSSDTHGAVWLPSMQCSCPCIVTPYLVDYWCVIYSKLLMTDLWGSVPLGWRRW